MRYRIGEISRLLGIPDHVIRFYERRGLVDPEKDYASNYRSYEEFDLLKLLQCRHYRGFGFSLSDSVDLVNEADPFQLLSRLEERKKELDEELARLSAARDCLGQCIENAGTFKDALGAPRFKDKPALLWLYSHNELREPCGDERIARATEWFMEDRVIPNLRFLCVIDRESLFGSGPFHYSWGLAIREDAAEALPEAVRKLMRRIEGGRYLSSLIANDKDCIITREHFAPMKAKAGEEGLEPRGPALAELLAVAHEGGEVVSRLDVSIPV